MAIAHLVITEDLVPQLVEELGFHSTGPFKDWSLPICEELLDLSKDPGAVDDRSLLHGPPWDDLPSGSQEVPH